MNFLKKSRWFSSLRKTQEQIPGGIWGARMWIDHPANNVVIQDEITRIAGWFYCEEPRGELSLRLADRPLECIEIDRPDVARIYPDGVSRGFCTFVDLSEYLGHRGRGSLPFSFLCGDRLLLSKEFQVYPGAWEGAERLPEVRRRKRRWLIERLCCPVCSGPLRHERADRTDENREELTCDSCGLEMPQDNKGALTLLPREIGDEAAVVNTERFSTHRYDDVAWEIIREAEQKGDMVLDCGSGLRTSTAPAVIACEIADYPSTDLKALNQNLPIKDNSFGAVLSLNVLEHVDDPFRCARELIRVLKPGRRLYCVVPFLQPLHGYPDHYFNMTKSGLDRLFRGAGSVESHTVPDSGHPIWSLHWFLTSYLEGLPRGLRGRFRDLTVREIVDRSQNEWMRDELGQDLSEKGRWTLASTTALVLRKT